VQALERHRLILYGRIGLSVALFVVAMGVGTAAALSGSSGSNALLVGGGLVASILLLPRRTRPRNDEAREQADQAELERFGRIQTWLTWTRGVYLVVALSVLVGLPRLL